MPPKKKVSPRKSLTPKEKMILEFLESYFREQAMAPSYREIKEHFGFASFYSVQRYLKQLTDKGYIKTGDDNQKRAIELVATADDITSKKVADSAALSENSESESLMLPLLGRVAAGIPIERKEHNEFFEVSKNLVPNPKESFVLRVEGESMIEDGILDGDYLIVQSQKRASKGDTVVAMVDEEATVKHFIPHSKSSLRALDERGKKLVGRGHSIELRPANSMMKSMFYPPEKVDIQGVLIGLVRKY